MNSKLIKHLQELKNIQNSKEFNLSNDEKRTLDEIINVAEINDLIKSNNEQVDKVAKTVNFQPDPSLKEIFSKVSNYLVIDALNEVLESNFDNTKKIKFVSTEFIGTTSDLTKRIIRGDLGITFEDDDNYEENQTIVVELQSTNKSNIPFRVHAYGNNHLKAINMEVKNGVGVEKVVKEVYARPYELVIYTSTDFKEKDGFLDFNTTAPKYKVNGINQYSKEGDVVTFPIPFINILQMSLEELMNSKFSFLQGIYLYRYKQNIDLVEKDKIKLTELSQEIEKNLRTILTQEDYDVIMKQHLNLMNDLYNIMSKQPEKYKEEINDMDYMVNTYAGRIEQRGVEQGMKRGVEQGMKRGVEQGMKRGVEQGIKRGVEQGMKRGVEQERIEIACNLLDILNDEQIASRTKLTTEEVAKIRKEHLSLKED